MTSNEMANFIWKLRDRNEMPIDENEYYLLGDIALRLLRAAEEAEESVLYSLNKNEIREQLDEIKNMVETDVHSAVSPDNWYVYSNLRDELDQLELLLKLNNIV